MFLCAPLEKLGDEVRLASEGTMDVSAAAKFVDGWGMWERGRCEGIVRALEVIEGRLSDGRITEEQREVLLVVGDSLRQANTRRPSRVPAQESRILRRVGAARQLLRRSSGQPASSLTLD